MNILEDLKSQFKKMVVTTKLIFLEYCYVCWSFSFWIVKVGLQVNYMSYVSLSSNPLDLLGNMVAATYFFFM
jgi:hypothetical protein